MSPSVRKFLGRPSPVALATMGPNPDSGPKGNRSFSGRGTTGQAAGACEALRPLVNTAQNASPALQACVDASPPGSTLRLPKGILTLYHQIKVGVRGLTIITENTPENVTTSYCHDYPTLCTAFKAAPYLVRPYPGQPFPYPCQIDEEGNLQPGCAGTTSQIVMATSWFGVAAPGVRLLNLIFDGNRAERRPYRKFVSGRALPLDRNVSIAEGSDGVVVAGCGIYNSMESTGLTLLKSTGGRFHFNDISLNHGDGFDIDEAYDTHITHNWIRHNGDYGLIAYSLGNHSRIAANYVVGPPHLAHSGIAVMTTYVLGNNAGKGNFENLVIEANTIDAYTTLPEAIGIGNRWEIDVNNPVPGSYWTMGPIYVRNNTINGGERPIVVQRTRGYHIYGNRIHYTRRPSALSTSPWFLLPYCSNSTALPQAIQHWGKKCAELNYYINLGGGNAVLTVDKQFSTGTTDITDVHDVDLTGCIDGYPVDYSSLCSF